MAKFSAAIADARRLKQNLQEADYSQRQAAEGDVEAAAERLLNGDETTIKTSTVEQIRALNERIAVLSRGRAKVKQAADEITDRLSFEVHAALVGSHNESLLKLYNACRAVARANESVIETYGALAGRGYTPGLTCFRRRP